MNIWRGTKVPISGVQVPAEWKPLIKDAYTAAGRDFGLDTQGAQAVSWYVWRLMIQKKPVALQAPTRFQPYNAEYDSLAGREAEKDPGLDPTAWGDWREDQRSVSALPLIDELRSLLK
jgi:hypothetical protein